METVRLLVSELVTNAVLHGLDRTSPIELRAHLLSDSVVISVTDDGTGFDPLESSASHPHEPGGLGLELVVALADERGIDSHRPFRRWFALSR